MTYLYPKIPNPHLFINATVIIAQLSRLAEECEAYRVGDRR